MPKRGLAALILTLAGLRLIVAYTPPGGDIGVGVADEVGVGAVLGTSLEPAEGLAEGLVEGSAEGSVEGSPTPMSPPGGV